MSDDEDFELQEKQAQMFFKFNGWRTCKTCGYAMQFDKSIVCGVWHTTFSSDSFCDQYVTEDERKAELEKRKQELLADPNSFINRFKNRNK
jgi:hypothetical protein